MANAAAPEQSCMMLMHRGVGDDKTSTNPGELFASDLDKEELREITVLGPALLAGGKLTKLGENCQKIERGRWLSHSCRAALCHPGWRAAGSCPREERLTPPALKKAFWKRLGAGCWVLGWEQGTAGPEPQRCHRQGRGWTSRADPGPCRRQRDCQNVCRQSSRSGESPAQP